MGAFCFVIMPYGGKFDEIYEKIYVPAIQEMGLEPLRADEIYNNQTIIEDIRRSIEDATLILADVTNRNPNVNYELGMAHALKKDVIITTANSEDVPSDYRPLRFLPYTVGEFDWNQIFLDNLKKTLRTVLDRINSHTAESQGFYFSPDPQTPSHAVLHYRGDRVMLECQSGAVSEWHAAAACLLNEKVRNFSNRLPEGHILRLRKVFFEPCNVHTFYVGYLYNQNTMPLYTANELLRLLEDTFDGQQFKAKIRYLEEDFNQEGFNVDNKEYYNDSLNETNCAVCSRDGFYIADLSKIFCNEKVGHCFYKLNGLLPRKVLGVDSYAFNESHWLADWGQKEPRFYAGETVKFKIQRIYPLAERSHTSNARNISFTILEKA